MKAHVPDPSAGEILDDSPSNGKVGNLQARKKWIGEGEGDNGSTGGGTSSTFRQDITTRMGRIGTTQFHLPMVENYKHKQSVVQDTDNPAPTSSK